MNNSHAQTQTEVKRLTCNELGVCQAKRPRCTGCTADKPPSYPFAPGTIQGGPRRPRSNWVFGVAAMAVQLTGAVLLVVACAYAAGYLVGSLL